MSDQDYDDELVSSNPNQRNWRGIFIAMLVIASVLALIVTSVVLLTPPDSGPKVKPGRLRLNQIVNGAFEPARFNGSWISGDELMYRDEHNNIVVLNALNLTVRTLMSNHTYARFNAVRFSMSPDHKFILLVHNTQTLFRHSFLAQYTVYDVAAGQTHPVVVSERTASGGGNSLERPYLVHAQWAPKGHGLVLILDYDIFYMSNPRSGPVYRVTSSAVPGLVHNGAPDWLYEEEILNDNKALWMSDDGHMLLYASFNSTLVREFRFPWYGVSSEGERQQQLYPEMRSLRYPKPGTVNPHVTLFVADLADPKNIRTRDLKPPMAFQSTQTTDYYFNGVSWVSATEVAVIWMNRAQNMSMVTLCKSPMWYCQETQRITGEKSGWVEAPPPPIFSSDGNTYLTLAPVRDGSHGYFRHVVSVNIPKKRFVPITQGTFEVDRIAAWDPNNQVVYYLASQLTQLHLYSVKTLPNSEPVCLTCPGVASVSLNKANDNQQHKTNQAKEKSKSNKNSEDETDETDESSTQQEQAPLGDAEKKKKPPAYVEEKLYRECLYHDVMFSPDASYYVMECLGPGIPTTKLYKAPNVFLMYLQNNTHIYDKVAKIALPQIKSFPVEISGGHQAQIRLFLPPGLREGEITKYPLLLRIYEGPGTQLVTEKWQIDWSTYLASTQDIIVGYIDGRGTSGKGYSLTHQVYKKLGLVEADDQLEVTEYLKDTLHFIDKRRVGVWGWGYGGFVAAMILSTPGQEIFQCGAAIAPITSWRLYDSAYTERYMGSPNSSENYKGYEEADLTKRAEHVKDKSLYLVHGTADDKIHFQQSLYYTKALSDAGVVFRQQIYPDENNSLSGVKHHLFRSLASFFHGCFMSQVPQESKAGLRNGGADCDVCASSSL